MHPFRPDCDLGLDDMEDPDTADWQRIAGAPWQHLSHKSKAPLAAGTTESEGAHDDL